MNATGLLHPQYPLGSASYCTRAAAPKVVTAIVGEIEKWHESHIRSRLYGPWLQGDLGHVDQEAW